MSLAALVATILALGFSAALSWSVVETAHLTGLSAEETISVQVATTSVSLSGLLSSGFLIGAIGVLADATASQAALVAALLRAEPEQGRVRLIRAALRKGGDHFGATVSTLVFAYAGAALPVLLLASLARRPVLDALTSDGVAVDIARGLVGVVAVAIAVPLTTVVAACAGDLSYKQTSYTP